MKIINQEDKIMMNIRLTMEELKALINKIEKAVPKKPST